MHQMTHAKRDTLIARYYLANGSSCVINLTRGADLITFPDFVGAPVTGMTEIDFADPAPRPVEAFYQLEEQ